VKLYKWSFNGFGYVRLLVVRVAYLLIAVLIGIAAYAALRSLLSPGFAIFGAIWKRAHRCWPPSSLAIEAALPALAQTPVQVTVRQRLEPRVQASSSAVTREVHMLQVHGGDVLYPDLIARGLS
jgi:hypothetical protein